MIGALPKSADPFFTGSKKRVSIVCAGPSCAFRIHANPWVIKLTQRLTKRVGCRDLRQAARGLLLVVTQTRPKRMCVFERTLFGLGEAKRNTDIDCGIQIPILTKGYSCLETDPNSALWPSQNSIIKGSLSRTPVNWVVK